MTGLGCKTGNWSLDLAPPWGVTAAIGNCIRQLEIAHADLMPDLHLGPTLIIASDYGGQHKGSSHEAFSFLLADLQFCWRWDEYRREIRTTRSVQNRRMSYKALNDQRRQEALPAFLAAADVIPGVLATVLINKSFMQALRVTSDERPQLPEGIARWPARVITKMTFVAHLGALFIAGLSREGQNILWMTDNDDFVANDERVIELTPLFAQVISQYSQRAMGHFRLGTMKCDNGDLLIEDLASLPDLAGGALCEIPMRGLLPKESPIQLPLRGHLPIKAITIIKWLSEIGHALRRVTFVVDHGDSRARARVRALDFYTD
jgi:hypothetical protein